MTVLLLAEHDNVALSELTARALTAASQMGEAVDILVVGRGAEGVAAAAARLSGVRRVLLADADALAAEGRFAEAAHLLLLRGVQCVGRLDQDTTGLLLMSDDGKFIHRMTSPRHHVPKVYEAVVKHPLDERQLSRLLEGVVLDDDPVAVRAQACSAVSERHLRMTLTEGKYHQVKRMVAAAGNRVEALHRVAVGRLELPADLAPGEWRWFDPAEV